jgi:hypothetical protein
MRTFWLQVEWGALYSFNMGGSSGTPVSVDRKPLMFSVFAQLTEAAKNQTTTRDPILLVVTV